MKRILLLALCWTAISNIIAFAQSTGVPSELSYQAYVTDDSGIPLAPDTPDSYEITMRIFDTAAAGSGTLLWSERHATEVHQGRIAIILGQGVEVPTAGAPEPRPDLSTVFMDFNRFTEITVKKDGETESKTLLPRQKLVSTATALRARFAEELAPGSPAELSLDGKADLTGDNGFSGNNNYFGTNTFRGKVNIGTPPQGSSFYRAKLEVLGQINFPLDLEGPHGKLDRFGAAGNLPSGNTPLSIYASNSVAAQDFRAYSDARIKNIEGRSNSAIDLQTLRAIEITDYTHKDAIATGNERSKKAIAQQVEEVFPLAVSRSTDVIPDIYHVAAVKNGWLKVATNLDKGDRVRIIDGKADGIHEVVEVKEGAFRTAAIPQSDKVFVYGREVTDFRSVDYTAISMLNVSATQEILRRLEAKEKEVEELTTRLNVMDGKMAAFEKVLATLGVTPASITLTPHTVAQ